MVIIALEWFGPTRPIPPNLTKLVPPRHWHWHFDATPTLLPSPLALPDFGEAEAPKPARWIGRHFWWNHLAKIE